MKNLFYQILFFTGALPTWIVLTGSYAHAYTIPDEDNNICMMVAKDHIARSGSFDGIREGVLKYNLCLADLEISRALPEKKKRIGQNIQRIKLPK